MREPIANLGPVCAAKAGIVRQVKPLTAKALRFRKIRGVVDGQMALELEAVCES